MCHKVYFQCQYCNAHRFFMWEECSKFWAQYRRIVINMDSFHARPQIGIVACDSKTGIPDTVLVCGTRPDKTRCRPFRLGACPRLHAKCPSLKEYNKAQEKQEEKNVMLEKLRVEREGRNSEQFKREFADKWFRKRLVPTYWRPPPSPPTAPWTARTTTRRRHSVDASGGVDWASEGIVSPTSEYVEEAGESNRVIVVEGKHDNSKGDETVSAAGGQVFLAERRDSAMQDGKGCLLGKTIAADGSSHEPEKEFSEADMAMDKCLYDREYP